MADPELSDKFRAALDEIQRLEATVRDLNRQKIVLEGYVAASDAEADRLRVDETQRRSEHARIEALKREIAAVRALAAAREQTIEYLLASRSWRITKPLRTLDRRLRGRQPESGGRGLALATFPIASGLVLASDVEGAWGDGWTGPTLRFRVKPVRAAAGLRIRGEVPTRIGDGQDLRLTIDGRSWTRHAGVGAFEWDVPLDLGTARAIEVSITASRAWQPAADGSSQDARVLSWLVLAVEPR